MKRKGILLACILATCSLVPLSAQLTVGGFIDLNIAGLNVASQNTGEEYSSFLGFGLGGVVTYPLTGGLAVQGEPMFLQKGGKVTEDGETLALKIFYFEIPVFLRYNITLSSGTVLPYLIVGPNLGFRAASKVVFPDGSSSDNKSEINGIDLGLGGGAGVEVPFNNLIFFGEARYAFGLTNINSEVVQGDESTVKNKGLQILLGAKVPLD